MSISIKITSASEAEELSQIQKAAFKPLYEKFHDERKLSEAYELYPSFFS